MTILAQLSLPVKVCIPCSIENAQYEYKNSSCLRSLRHEELFSVFFTLPDAAVFAFFRESFWPRAPPHSYSPNSHGYPAHWQAETRRSVIRSSSMFLRNIQERSASALVEKNTLFDNMDCIIRRCCSVSAMSMERHLLSESFKFN